MRQREQKGAPAVGDAAALPLRAHDRQRAPARQLLRHAAHVLAAHAAHLRLLLARHELSPRDAGPAASRSQTPTPGPDAAPSPSPLAPRPSPLAPHPRSRPPQASRAICLLSIHKNSLGAFLCLLSGFPDLITVVLLSRRPGMHQMAASNAFGSFAFNSCFSLGKLPHPSPNPSPLTLTRSPSPSPSPNPNLNPTPTSP